MLRMVSIFALLLAIVMFDGATRSAFADGSVVPHQTVRPLPHQEKQAVARARQAYARDKQAYARNKQAHARQKQAAARAATNNEDQQNAAREAYRRGEIKSLSVIRRTVITSYQGRIISTQFQEIRDGRTRYIYNFRVLSSNGEMMQVRVNARNARIIKVTGER